MTPYAYTLGDHYPRLFPTLEAVVRHLVAKGATPSRYLHRYDHELRGHVADDEQGQDVDLKPYMVQVPVDEVALRAELMVRVADDRVEFEKTYPRGRTGLRCSGSNWLCESSPEELERILAREIERRSWQWKPLS